MPTDTNVNTLIINKLTKAQYDAATKSNTELYMVTDANNDVITLPMFFATYQPRKLNNSSWLRADPYSWHSADLYVSAYAHLVDGFNNCAKLHSWVNNGVYYWTTSTSPSVGDDVYGGIPRAVVGTVQAVGNNTITYNNTVYTLDTTYIYGFQEQIAGTTITFYKLSDEIKVVLPDQQTNLDTIYNATGIGYYFVLDTTNRQFKLPRNTYGFTGFRGDVGGYVAESLPNFVALCGYDGQTGNYRQKTVPYTYRANTYQSNAAGVADIDVTYGSEVANKEDAPVQQRATQAYLYFYVGNTIQNETSVDVGEMTEAINDKVDLASSFNFPANQYDTLTLGTSGEEYTAPADGYYCLSKNSGAADKYIFFDDDDNAGAGIKFVSSGSQRMDVMYPIKKGRKIKIVYSASGSTVKFRFVYAQKTN